MYPKNTVKTITWNPILMDGIVYMRIDVVANLWCYFWPMTSRYWSTGLLSNVHSTEGSTLDQIDPKGVHSFTFHIQAGQPGQGQWNWKFWVIIWGLDMVSDISFWISGPINTEPSAGSSFSSFRTGFFGIIRFTSLCLVFIIHPPKLRWLKTKAWTRPDPASRS